GHEILLVVPARERYAPPPPGVELLGVQTGDASNQEELWLRFGHEVGALDGLADVDIIHGNDWMTAIAGLRLRAKLHVPLAFTVHLPQAGGYNRASELCALAEAECVIVHSRAVAGEIAARQLPLKSLRVIQNGVDVERFVPPSQPREAGLI